MPLITCPECAKNVSDQAASCPHCGYPVAKRPETELTSSDISDRRSDWSVLDDLAVILIIAGLCCGLYFLFWYDTSVSTLLGDVNNVGKLQNRQLGMICGLASLLVGILLLAIRRRKA